MAGIGIRAIRDTAGRFALFLLLLTAALAARAAERDWTLLVYLDGDNNLEPFALSDLEEMEAGHPGEGVEVLVLVDRAEGFTADWDDWTGARLYRIRPDRSLGLASELLEDYGEINMGDPAVLEAFVRDGLARFPAERTGLVFWNHGGGWSNLVNDDAAPGSPSGHDHLTLEELRSATRAGLDAVGATRLDLIGFDMCLMGQLETIEAVGGLGRFLVASQAIEPGDGWPWNRVVALLDGDLSTRDVATGTVDAFDAFYRARNEPVTTLAAYDLEAAPAVLEALDTVAGRLVRRADENWREVVRGLFYAESYNELGDVKRGRNALQSVDLRHALANVAEADQGLARDGDYRSLQAALDRLVLTSRNSAQHRLSSGVAIYAPFRADLYNPDYGATGLGAGNAWGRLLGAVHGAQASAPSVLEISSIQLWNDYRGQQVPDIVQLGQDGFLTQVRARNALRALWWLGERDAEGGLLLFDKDAGTFGGSSDFERTERPSRMEAVQAYAVPDGESEIYSRYDGTRLVVSNGRETGLATLDHSDIEARENGLYFVEVIYEHPDDGRYEGTLRFNWLWEADSLVLALPQQDGRFAYRSISPRPDAQIHLLADRYGRDGALRKIVSSTLTWGEGLSLTLELVEPGAYAALIGLEDLGGRSTFELREFDVSPRN
ncbi:MAG: clostripain-related cysteine peptidase, partial [Pseudomonadales bacterium]|nr:clostripain-related cysteine peptidase [Pseudomonadales bacterium]